MSISTTAIREEMRRRLIDAVGIDPQNSLQIENETFDNLNKPFWIAEYCLGGSESSKSNFRSRMASFLIQYDVISAEGTGTAVIDDLCDKISSAFDLNDPGKSCFQSDNMDAVISSVSIERKNYAANYAKSVLFTIDLFTIPNRAVDKNGIDENTAG